VMPGALVLIEAKVFKYMDGLSKLPIYKALIKRTPELKEHRHKPVRMVLLVPRILPWIKAAADEVGVEVRDWVPDWVMKIWEERDKYWTPEATLRRERRKRILRLLGFE